MTLEAAKKLQKKMPYKQIYFDSVHDCYRVLDPKTWHEYKDEAGKIHKRIRPETLIPILT